MSGCVSPDVFMLTCSLDDYGRSVSSGASFFTSDLLGALGFCSLSYLWQTSNGPGFYLDTVCV